MVHDVRFALRLLLRTPTLTAVIVATLLVAGLAAWLPSRGAARVDPLITLREG
jgi:ABC-type lipoprotein release transport system permease subunit